MRTRLNKQTLVTIVISLIVFSTFTISAFGQLSPAFEEMRSEIDNEESLVEVIVLLEGDDVRDAISVSARDRHLTRSERIKDVNSRLRSYRSYAADQVESFLNDYSSGEITRFFIVPGYAASIPFSEIENLSAIDGVELIIPNVELTFDPPVETRVSPQMSTAVSSYLELMNVPSLWQRGIDGSGRLVCSFDTGVEQSHPALSAKWRGNHAGLHESWFSTIKPDTLPYDAAGHGTHTMGTMVGSVDADSIGVAPGAEFIAAGVVDQGKTLTNTLADILLAFQWVLDPDGNPLTTNDVPDVVLNSWGIPKGIFDDCDSYFWQAIDNVEAAGIVTIFAAGNEGPDPSTLRLPADRGTTPLNTFCVGAVDGSKTIASFSSRGPSRCHPDQVKPEIVAPGVSVRSSTKGGGYLSMSGTSMAAPYIAGLVALCRQYSPDATVAEIKNALIASCQDLGEAGEDNAYGYGLPDASKILDYLPEPIVPEFSVEDFVVMGSETVMPGDTVSMLVELSNTTGAFSQVFGELVSDNTAEAEVISSEALFSFTGGATITTGASPFQVRIDGSLPHGLETSFKLYIKSTGGDILDSTNLVMTVGIAPPGRVATHQSDGISVSISDFGQMGFGPGSIYYAGGEGFRFESSSNLLYEAGIVVACDGYDLSSTLRNADGSLRISDFAPIESIGAGWSGDDQGFHFSCSFADQSSNLPAPLTITQESIDFGGSANDGVTIVRYHLTNTSSQDLQSVRFGFLADFDLEGGAETIENNDSLGMLYQYSDDGPMVGLIKLANIGSVTAQVANEEKAGWTDTDLHSFLLAEQVDFVSTSGDDVLYSVNSSALTLAAGETIEVSFAFVAGNDLYELEDNAVRAAERYEVVLATSVGGGQLPESFVLQQNYPNPFNPSTTIAFDLKVEATVSLDIYNMLGQKVTCLYSGSLGTGRHEFEWNGDSSSGNRVATGVYFYRLSTEDYSDSRKMLLLK